MFNMILGLSQTWDIPQDWYFNWEQIRWNMGVAYFQTNSFYFKYQPSKKKDKLNPTKKVTKCFLISLGGCATSRNGDWTNGLFLQQTAGWIWRMVVQWKRGVQPTMARYLTIYKAGWFGTCVIFPYIGNFIIPTDLHILQRGRYATNQKAFVLGRCKELSPQNRMCSTWQISQVVHAYLAMAPVAKPWKPGTSWNEAWWQKGLGTG